MRERAAAPDAVEGEPRRCSGHPQSPRPRRPAAPRAEAALVQGPGPRGAGVPLDQQADREREPPHRRPGGAVPEHRRVLAAGDRDVHDHRRRLYPVARRGSKFERSCRVLRNAKELGGDKVVTKSGLMVGLGESFDEMLDALGALRENHVQVLTVGQYLRPTENHLPIVRYWHPDEFAQLESAAYELGFEHVAAGPLVRSSYHADEHVPEPRS